MKLEGRVAIVTGAAGGLGKAMAKELSEQGATVVMSDVNEELLNEVVENLKKDNYQVEGIPANVADKNSVHQLVNKTIEKFHSIDILVNNAGGSLNTPKKLEEIKEEDWDLVLNVNLKGTFFCSQAVVPYMRKNKRGAIVNLASIGGRTASPVTGVAYAAAKGGIISFTRRLALEVGQDQIRVNTLAPGLVISGERMQGMFDALTPDEKTSVLQGIPLKRTGTVEEMAKAVAFLVSDDANYITGAVLDVNGGRFMG